MRRMRTVRLMLLATSMIYGATASGADVSLRWGYVAAQASTVALAPSVVPEPAAAEPEPAEPDRAEAEPAAEPEPEPAADPDPAESELARPEPAGVDPPGTRIDPATGLSSDPDDWYTAGSIREIDDEHRMLDDVAAAYFSIDGRDGACPGGYRVRTYPLPRTAVDAEYPLTAEADSLTSEIDVKAEFFGNVTVEQGNRRIVAPRADIDYETRIARFPEGVRVDQPGLIMQGSSASIDTSSDEAELEDVQFVMTDIGMRGGADNVFQGESGDLTLQRTRFTRCAPGDNGWLLSMSKLEIEREEVFGTARNAVLRLRSVPVFYSPYLKFPVSGERQSGFLFPNLSYSEEDGLDVSVPYYLNLAPNYDATIIPRYISDRGAGAEAEFRHKSSWQDSIVSGAILPKDDLFDGEFDREDFDDLGGEPVLGPFEPADRWLVGVEHSGGVGKFRTLVDYTAVSDRDYFRDLGSDLGVSSRIELERKGEIQYTSAVGASGNLFARLWAQRFQRIDEIETEAYQRLPELEVTYNTQLPGPFEFSLGAEWVEFDRDTASLNGLAAVTGRRIHAEPRFRMPLTWPFGFFSMMVGYRQTEYELDQDSMAGGVQLMEDSPDRGIGLGSVDGGLFFERDLDWFGTDLIQTLEPRVYYLYQEYADQSELPRFDASDLTFGYSQLFRDNRFSGLDRIGDANQVAAGVTTRFISRTSGREFLRASIGEIRYLEDRQVTLGGRVRPDERQSSSAIASDLSARLWRNWRVRGSLVWDPHDNQTDEAGAAIQYRRSNRHIVNLGFRRRLDENIEQTDFSVYWPVTKRFAIVGRWNYDLVSGRTIEGFGGIEYDDCCLKVRLMARRFLDSPTGRNLENVDGDDGILLQIVFKGLAGFGTKVESVLERGVRGYRSPEMRDYFNNRLD